MANNTQQPIPDNARPAPDVPQELRPRLSQSAFKMILLLGVVLAHVYLYYVVASFSIVPLNTSQADFQNKTTSYYDVLSVSPDANNTEILQGYIRKLSKLEPSNSETHY